ncbi:MAG: c-type cytochrome [Xanthobacteraceae bacterium]
MFRVTIIGLASIVASHSFAADADNGRRLAQSHCTPCHKLGPDLRGEVSDAPPFGVIGAKYRFDADAITAAIVGPHPKMNFSPQPGEAADIAAYIGSLGK